MESFKNRLMKNEKMLEAQLNNEYMRTDYEPIRLFLYNVKNKTYSFGMVLELLKLNPVKTYEERAELQGYEATGNPQIIEEINSYARKINQAVRNNKLTEGKLEEIRCRVERIFNGNHQRTNS